MDETTKNFGSWFKQLPVRMLQKMLTTLIYLGIYSLKTPLLQLEIIPSKLHLRIRTCLLVSDWANTVLDPGIRVLKVQTVKSFVNFVYHVLRSLSVSNNRLDWFHQGRNQKRRSITSVFDERSFFDLLLNFLAVRSFEKKLLLLIGRVVQTDNLP